MIEGIAVGRFDTGQRAGTANLEEYSKLYTGYNALYLSLDDIVADLNISQAVNQDTKKLFDAAKQRYNALAVTDVVHVNTKVLNRCQDEVNKLIPNSSLWYPAFPAVQEAPH